LNRPRPTQGYRVNRRKEEEEEEEEEVAHVFSK
jgi:hypothetical protein